jgi:hypothetical protein
MIEKGLLSLSIHSATRRTGGAFSYVISTSKGTQTARTARAVWVPLKNYKLWGKDSTLTLSTYPFSGGVHPFHSGINPGHCF